MSNLIIGSGTTSNTLIHRQLSRETHQNSTKNLTVTNAGQEDNISETNIDGSMRSMDIDFNDEAFIFSKMEDLENNVLFSMAQKSPEGEKISVLLS